MCLPVYNPPPSPPRTDSPLVTHDSRQSMQYNSMYLLTEWEGGTGKYAMQCNAIQYNTILKK